MKIEPQSPKLSTVSYAMFFLDLNVWLSAQCDAGHIITRKGSTNLSYCPFNIVKQKCGSFTD